MVELIHLSKILGCVSSVALMAAEVRRIWIRGSGNNNGTFNDSGRVFIVCYVSS